MQIGVQQSFFLAGFGGGGLVCAILVKQHHERQLLLWLPLVGSIPLFLLTFVTGLPMTVCVAIVGLTIGTTLPVMLSYGQRLVPSAQRLASSMAMGVSWGIGGTAATILVGVADQLPRPEWVFVVFAAAAVGAGVLSVLLPKIPGPESV